MRGIGSFAHEVELIDNRTFVLGHNFFGLQTLAMLPVLRSKSREYAQHIEVLFDLFLDARPEYLDDDLGTTFYLCRVHLCNGRSCKRLAVETFEDFINGLAVSAFDDRKCLLGWKRRNRVLQFCQFIGNVFRQQVATGG